MLDERTFGRIRKLHIVNGDRPRLQRNIPRIGGRFFGFLLQKLEHTCRTRDGILQLGDNAGHLVERLGVLVGIAQKTRKRTHCQPAVDDGKRADESHRRIAERVDKPRAGIGERRKEDGFQRAGAQLFVQHVKLLLRFFLLPHRLQKLQIADALLNERCLIATHRRLFTEHVEGLAGDIFRQKQRQRRDQDNHQRDKRVQRHHQTDRAENRHHTGEKL